MRRILLASLLCASCAGTLAHEADFNISDKSINAQGNFLNDARTMEFGAGYVYRKGGTNIANLDLHAQGQTAIGNYPTTVGIGARWSVFDENSVDGNAIGLGGYAHIKIPEVPGLGVKGVFHYAPSITSFSDSTQFYRADVRVTYRIIENADVYGGYRNIRTEVNDDRKVSLDESFNLGITLHF